MSNPYAAFNISDDEEDNKVTVVKAEDKPKRSINTIMQPTKTKRISKNNKKKLRKLFLKLQLHLLLLRKITLKKESLILIWKEIKETGKKNHLHLVIPMTEKVVLEDSKNYVI